MTNAEKNFNKVLEFVAKAGMFGVNKNDQMQSCNTLHCSECVLNNGSCSESRMEWLKTEYV